MYFRKHWCNFTPCTDAASVAATTVWVLVSSIWVSSWIRVFMLESSLILLSLKIGSSTKLIWLAVAASRMTLSKFLPWSISSIVGYWFQSWFSSALILSPKSSMISFSPWSSLTVVQASLGLVASSPAALSWLTSSAGKLASSIPSSVIRKTILNRTFNAFYNKMGQITYIGNWEPKFNACAKTSS